MTTTTDQLTRTEATLAMTLSLIASTRCGEIARASGFPAPTAEQAAELGATMTRAIVETIRGLRDEGPMPSEVEIAEVIEGVAEGAILRVLGRPPAARGDVN